MVDRDSFAYGSNARPGNPVTSDCVPDGMAYVLLDRLRYDDPSVLSSSPTTL